VASGRDEEQIPAKGEEKLEKVVFTKSMCQLVLKDCPDLHRG
jgi:hypothetical protein